MNRGAFATVLGALLTSLINLITEGDDIHFLIGLGIAFKYSLILVLHYFDKIRLGKLYLATLIPLWYSLTMFFIGGNFNQGLVAVTNLAIAYLLFENEKTLRWCLVIHNILLYLIPSIYLAFYPPIFGVRDFPLDELIVFFVSIGWIAVIFFTYQAEKEELIQHLQEKNDDLERTTAELEQFTYIASHDLKSPIRNVISFLGLIERKLKQMRYGEVTDDITFAKESAQQMHHLVNDILEISRANTQAKDQRIWVDLRKVALKVKMILKHEFIEKQAQLQIGELPNFHCHEAEMIVVFQNLIQNAIKYNEQATPTVEIYSEIEEEEMRIYFNDNGIGIEDKYIEQIFEFFKRLHTQETYKGTGLGLAVCKKIIKSYGGTISVQSKLGEGSTFMLSLPTSV